MERCVFAGLRRIAGGWRFWSLLLSMDMFGLVAGRGAGGSDSTNGSRTLAMLRCSFLLIGVSMVSILAGCSPGSATASGGGEDVSIGFSPKAPTSLQAGTSTSLTAVITGASSSAVVEWTVTCGTSACGSFSSTTTSSGESTTYTAPTMVPTGNGNQVDVTATSSVGATADTAGITITSASTGGSAAGTWTWEGGSDVADETGTYGSLGIAAAANVPGSRWAPASWTDTSGNFWLFGGQAYSATGAGWLYENDLWKYGPGTGEWTWVGGSSAGDQDGTYGTLGTASANNIPGGRSNPTHWTDASGNFWLFGGGGFDSQGNKDYLNDLWKYSPSSGEWEWVAGGDIGDDGGQYGTKGTAAAGNTPSSRSGGLGWVDASGNLWLFGGYGLDSEGNLGYLNDLWKYSPATNEWTWISGSDVYQQDGSYGTKGTAAASNVPGARTIDEGWIDTSGNLWMFGGVGYDSTGSDGGDAYLDDLWKYNISSGEWTWVGGSDIGNQLNVYGTEGTAAASNMPCGRTGSFTWTDAAGNFWFFGGAGNVDALGDAGIFSDVWMYSPSSGEWTWMDGPQGSGSAGTYGTEGTGSASDIPGARFWGATWKDTSGDIWIFGGDGVDSVSTGGTTGTYLNDLWKYEP